MPANDRTKNRLKFSCEALVLDEKLEIERIVNALQEGVYRRLRRKGAVVGISGGIDSAVVFALCVRAFGPERVVGVLLPERESSPESTLLANELAARFGVQTVTEEITAALEGFGCYQRRNEAIRSLIPDYMPGWKVKIVLPGSLLEQETLNVFYLVVPGSSGSEIRKRLPPAAYYQIVAASNFKQRARMSMLYYHAELRNYCVIGTANKNEHDLGFFVKHGDGGVDINPIVHLYKSQIFQLAGALDVPESIQSRAPTTDTYPGGGTQEEFFFRLPFFVLDTIWFGYEQGISKGEIASALSISEEQVQRIMDDIVRKQRTTAFLRAEPIAVTDLEEAQ